jgi:uncharacterized protein with HEPN domain
MAAATVPDRLEPMVRSLDVILGHWKGKRRIDYADDEIGRAATERHLGIISRASRHVPAKDKADYPQIPWKDIADIGNVLRHRYDTVSDDKIWEIVTLELRALRSAIKKIIAKHERKK